MGLWKPQKGDAPPRVFSHFSSRGVVWRTVPKKGEGTLIARCRPRDAKEVAYWESLTEPVDKVWGLSRITKGRDGWYHLETPLRTGVALGKLRDGLGEPTDPMRVEAAQLTGVGRPYRDVTVPAAEQILLNPQGNLEIMAVPWLQNANLATAKPAADQEFEEIVDLIFADSGPTNDPEAAASSLSAPTPPRPGPPPTTAIPILRRPKLRWGPILITAALTFLLVGTWTLWRWSATEKPGTTEEVAATGPEISAVADPTPREDSETSKAQGTALCPSPSAALGLLDRLLALRAEALDTANVAALSAVEGGLLLAADELQLQDLNGRGETIEGADFRVLNVVGLRCDAGMVQVTAWVYEGPYGLCGPAGCETAPETESLISFGMEPYPAASVPRARASLTALAGSPSAWRLTQAELLASREVSIRPAPMWGLGEL